MLFICHSSCSLYPTFTSHQSRRKLQLSSKPQNLSGSSYRKNRTPERLNKGLPRAVLHKEKGLFRVVQSPVTLYECSTRNRTAMLRPSDQPCGIHWSFYMWRQRRRSFIGVEGDEVDYAVCKTGAAGCYFRGRISCGMSE